MISEGRAGNGEAAYVERAIGDGQAEIARRAELRHESADFGFDVVGVVSGKVGGGPVGEVAAECTVAGVEKGPVEIHRHPPPPTFH